MRTALVLLVLLFGGSALAKPPKAKAVPYVAITQLADKDSGRAELLKVVDERMRQKLAELGTIVAPVDEPLAAAKATIAKKKLKGYELRAELSRSPEGGLRLSVLCFSYPGRSLLGEVSVKGAGGRPADLARALAAKVIEEAADTFEWES